MVSFLKIPENCIFDKPKSNGLLKKFYEDAATKRHVRQIEWIASIKPGFSAVSAVKNENLRYEEIEIFYIILSDLDSLYDVCRPVFRKVKYPCLLTLEYKDVVILSACPFAPGKQDYDNNILQQMVFSHCLFQDEPSEPAVRFLERMNVALNKEASLADIYQMVVNEISNFPLGGIVTSNYLAGILEYVDKNVSFDVQTHLVYKQKHDRIGNQYERYHPKSRSKQGWNAYDSEEVWHRLMQNEKGRNILQHRRCRDMETLMHRYEEWLDDYPVDYDSYMSDRELQQYLTTCELQGDQETDAWLGEYNGIW